MTLAITPRSILALLGLVLLALFILVAGPYIAIADYRPLESLLARLVAILAIVLLRVLWLVYRRLKAGRATDRLMAGVARPSAAEAARPGEEAVQLRERFEEAVATLKQQRRGRGIYDLPWYVFIGAPGSGKTTALVNSGLKFPLEQRMGRGALRGVGGTRNCDWWFTDEAVFLDTAGRYTTQDSDAAADAAAWTEFLRLLRQYRKRRPLNGVILTISAQDLMTLGPDGRAAHVAAARRRLDELNQELRVRLPVYVLLTKCDLVDGFTEYFSDLTAEGRAEVWGVTFSRQETESGQAARALGQEIDALMVRLNERVFGRLEEEVDARRRTRVFGFPQQMAALRPLLDEYVTEVFGSTRFDSRILLRGVYVTSGTQEGTPIDRLLSSIGRRFGMASEAVVPAAPGRGKAFFIEKLLKNVLIGESGLAGLNWRQELRLGAVQLCAYIAMVAAAIVGVFLFSWSYRANRVYLGDVSAAVATLDQTPVAAAGAPLDAMLPRLNSVRGVWEVANRFRADTPLTMRWGLFQGTSVGNAATDAYASQLRNALLPFLVERLERRLTDYAADPDTLYEYLKAYLMFRHPERLDRAHLGMIASLEAGGEGVSPELAAHLRTLFEEDVALTTRPLNDVLIAQARSTIQAASRARLIYNRVRLVRSEDKSRDLRLDAAAGVGAERVLQFRSGRKLSEPVPGFFTAPSFKEIAGPGTALGFVKEFATDAWVWGEAGPSLGDSIRIADEVIDIYEREYIKTWDTLLKDIEPVPFRQSADAQAALGILSAPTSPLRGLLKVVDENTYLTPPPDPATPGAMSSLQQAAGKLLAQTKAVAGVSAKKPGKAVTDHFANVHLLMTGSPPPIERILGKLEQIRQVLLKTGAGPGQTGALDTLADQQITALINELKQDAALLPPGIAASIAQVGTRTQQVLSAGATTDLMNQYQQDVQRECTRLLSGRYPFSAASPLDVSIEDFSRLFGPGGVFDAFFASRLKLLVDTTATPWSWKPGSVGASPQMPRQFQNAQSVRRLFFASGATPRQRLTLTVLDIEPASVSKFKLEIDGQKFEYTRGGPRSFNAAWPGDGPPRAAVGFEGGAGVQSASYEGPWGWLRLLDAARAQPESDGRAAVITVRANVYSARLRIEAASVDNPFTRGDWRQFGCGF